MPKKKLKDLNFLTTTQLSILLNVKPSFLHGNRYRGGDDLIPYHKFGGKVLYEESEVLDHLEKIKRKTPKDKAA